MALPFTLVYAEGYYLPIGSHVFPAEKYRLIHQRLLDNNIADSADFLTPQPASDDDIRLVHTEEYVRKLLSGTLSPMEIQLLEIPYSQQLVEAFWLAAGGSILGAEQSLQDGVAINIGGGFHHAFPDHGEGFCMVHDVAVAIRKLQSQGKIARAMTVDCDVHHGNGTASIFPPSASPPTTLPSAIGGARAHPNAQSVFTISLHQQNNYPTVKPPSAIDVNLPDRVDDSTYLQWLDNALSSGLRQFSPDLICYIAGADPYRDDQLGGLALTIEGLKQRDRLVFQVGNARNIPVMVTYAGGYARNVEDTVTIHTNTVVAATDVFSG